jgi:hypothetical protein
MLVGAFGVAYAREAASEDLVRTDVFRGRSLSELGPVRAWTNAYRAVAGSPWDVTTGLGPGNFAGLAAARAVEERPITLQSFSRTAREVLDQPPDYVGGAVFWITNTWSNLLAESGFIGLAIFALALGGLAVPVCVRTPASPFDARMRTLFTTMLAVVLWQGVVSPYTNWAEPILAYPMMVVAAYCHRSFSTADPPGSDQTPNQGEEG